MKLKGEMVIELTDVNTGDVETITETNMVTNLVNNLLGINPMGVFYNTAGTYEFGMNWNSELLPICPNMIGGILFFSKAITENEDNIYLSSDNLPVAYASNDVNATLNTKRGSMNLTESKALDNGYRFVWEFTPSQGNGTIAAVGLLLQKLRQGNHTASGYQGDQVLLWLLPTGVVERSPGSGQPQSRLRIHLRLLRKTVFCLR